MKALKKVDPHSSPKMDSQANYCVQDGEDARPNTDIPSQIEADGIRPSSQDIPRPTPKRYRKKDQTGIGSSHAQAMANIWRRCCGIRQAGDRDCQGSESDMPRGSPNPISSFTHAQSLASIVLGSSR